MYCEKYVEMGRKIRYYRIMQELGQGMLAEQIGITPQYLSKIGPGIPHCRQAAGEGVAPAGGLLKLYFSSFLWYNTHVIASARGN